MSPKNYLSGSMKDFNSPSAVQQSEGAKEGVDHQEGQEEEIPQMSPLLSDKNRDLIPENIGSHRSSLKNPQQASKIASIAASVR
jgi:hypothetical protein